MRNTMRLERESIGKLLFEFSLPAVIATLVNATYNIVDRIFIGQGVGSLALAGIGIAFPIMMIAIAFGMLVGVGSGTLVSIRLGEHNKDEAEKLLGNALSIFFIQSIILTTLALVFLEPLLRMLGATEKTFIFAKDYMQIIAFSFFFNFISYGLNSLIRSEGNPNFAMVTTLVGALTNCILDPLFIFVFDWGVKGAAWATLLSNVASSALVLYHFTLGKKRILSLTFDSLILSTKRVVSILRIGLSPFLMQLASSLVAFIVNNSLLRYSSDFAIAAMTIINGVMMVIAMPIIGISQGAQPLLGYNYGAKHFHRVKKVVILAIQSAMVISVFGFLIVEFIPETLFALFGSNNPEVNAIGIPGMRIFLSSIILAGIQIIGANYFQAIGKVKVSIFLNLLRQFILFIPLLLILPPIFGINGVWFVAPVADIVSCTITIVFLVGTFKKQASNINYH